MKDANEDAKPSLANSQKPPNFSSSTFWNETLKHVGLEFFEKTSIRTGTDVTCIQFFHFSQPKSCVYAEFLYSTHFEMIDATGEVSPKAALL
uniref:Uncharacterized protein n=1 Tax=Romanomermis culicivorax TaxID=13658 RepID=A0A915L7J1_ROMCU